MRGRYAVSERLPGLLRLLKNLLESVGLPSNYMGMSVHPFISWFHFTFSREQALKVGLDRAHWDPIFNSGITDRDRKRREEGIV